MTLLIAGGDSYTWGNELPDCKHKTASQLTWSALYAQQNGHEYECVAKPGCSNGAISRRVIDAVAANLGKDLFVLVMWSFIGRYEVSIDPTAAKDMTRIYHNSDIDGNHINITPWQTIPLDEKKLRMEVGADPSWNYWLDRQHKDYTKYGIFDLSRSYYSIVTKESQDTHSIHAILALQSYLKQNNIPYRFASVTQEIHDLLNSPHPISSLIDRNMWWGDTGMWEWSKAHDFPITAMNHPNPEAHAEWLRVHAV